MSPGLMPDGRDGERSQSSRGFSILEVAVMLALIAAVVAMVAPVLAGMTRRTNETSVQRQEKEINTAIFGDPASRRFGFIGDVGRLPTSLGELVSRGGLPAFHINDGATPHVGNIGYGWNGPYLGGLFSDADIVTDPWGQAFSYSNSGATAGQVTSGGADGTVAGNTDDITFPIHAPATTGTVFVTVIANGIANPFGAAAKLYYPINGEQTVTPTQKFDPTSPQAVFDGFAFAGVTPGVRMAVATHTDNGGPNCGSGTCCTITRTVPINVIAGQNNSITIRMNASTVVKVTGNYTCTIPD